MTTLAVQFYDVVVWLHVSAVVVALGPTFAYGIIIAVASRDDPRSVPIVYRVLQRIDMWLVTSGAIVILVTGIYLASDRWDFGDFFVAWGVLAIIVLLGLVHGFFRPNELRAEELARREVEDAGPDRVEWSDEFNRLSRRMATVGPIAGLIVILSIYVMVAKPFL